MARRSLGRGGRQSLRFMVISSCPEPWGGSEELWFGAVCALREQGHEVEVLKTLVDFDHPRIRHLRELSCRVEDLWGPSSYRRWHAASTFLPERYELLNRRDLVRAARAMVSRRPDLVIVGQGQNQDGLRFARLCRRFRLGYVLISQKATELTWPLDEVRAHLGGLIRGARLKIFVSEHNRRLTEEQFDISLDDALVLRNPVLAGREGPLPWPPDRNGEVRLAFVGRLDVQEKGQDLLLRVLARDPWRERPLRVSFFGQGVHREGLVDLAARLGVDRVSFQGQAGDIEEVWRNHHALVLTSKAEGLPLVVLEAMMCGRPGIVTDVGGSAEIVQDGVTGFVASGPTVAAIDETLERAWERRGDWPALGEAAAARIRELVPEDPVRVLAERLVELASTPAKK